MAMPEMNDRPTIDVEEAAILIGQMIPSQYQSAERLRKEYKLGERKANEAYARALANAQLTYTVGQINARIDAKLRHRKDPD